MSKESYEEFVDKFKQKLTTDDCYTPPEIMEAVEEWVAEKYGVERWQMVRPFWPGEDYTQRTYKPHEVVVDNPPFSIITQIVKWFLGNGVRFFLFAPALTLLNPSQGCCGIATGAKVTYANGAEVPTSFVTNLDEARLRTAPDLYRRVEAANTARLKAGRVELPKYTYPDEVVTAAIVKRWCKHGITWGVRPEDCVKIGALDSQKEEGKTIFGGGLLLSEHAAAKRAAAERAAAKRAEAERAAAERAAAEHAAAHVWTLSQREKELQAGLGRREAE